MRVAVVAVLAVALGTLVAALPTATNASCEDAGRDADADVSPALWPFGYRCDFGGGSVATLAPSVLQALAVIALTAAVLVGARRWPERADVRGALAGLAVVAWFTALAFAIDLDAAAFFTVWLAPPLAGVVDHAVCPPRLRALGRSALAGLAVGLSSAAVVVFFILSGWPAVGIVLGPLAGAAAAYFPAWLLHPPSRRNAG